MRTGKLSHLAVPLERLLQRREARVKAKEPLAALVWPECVGPFYARRTHVTRVGRGIMYVWCGSPALAHQLSLDAPEIIRRINAELNGEYIQEIRPATTGHRLPGAAERAPAPRQRPRPGELGTVRLPKAEVDRIEAQAARIPNDALRERFRRSALRQRRLQLWRELQGHRRCRHCGWLMAPELEHCTNCGRGA
jgi:predicted nucleic acid-binding Zn ribbon protein